MKRSFSSIFLALLFVLFSYNSIQIALAEITERDLTSLINESVFITKIAGNQPGGAYRTQYRQILQTKYDSLKNDPSATVQQLNKAALEDFNIYLNGIINKTVTYGDGRDSAVTAQTLKIQTDAYLAQIESTNDYLSGKQTAEETAKKNADIQKKADGIGDSECKISLSGMSLLSCVDTFFAWIIKTFLLSLAGVFVWFFGTMFHLSIYYGVLNFSSLATEGALYPLWQTVRDIVNLTVLFFGLGAVVMYLINREDKLKHFVPWVILYVLFVNFSWTASRTMVDYSNILTLKVYEIAIPNALASGTNILTGQSAAGLIMDRLGLQTIVSSVTSSPSGSSDKFLKNITSTPVALLLVIMALYVAYLFLISAIIFATRTGILMFCIIASPFLLVDSVLPWVGNYAEKARKIFFSQLVVGFIFMVFFFFTVQIMDILKTMVSGAGDLSQATSGGKDVGLFFGVFIMIIVLSIMLKVVKELSGEVGSVVNKAAGIGLAFAGGGAGIIGRGTLGAVASRASNSNWLDRQQGYAWGRALKGGAEKAATSTYDFRNLTPIKNFATGQGITLGAPIANYNDTFAARSKQINTTADSIRDKDARNQYLSGKRDGLFNIRKTVDDNLRPMGNKGDYRSGNRVIVDERQLEEYKKLRSRADKEAFRQSNPGLKERLDQVDKDEEDRIKKQVEEQRERDEIKARARRSVDEERQAREVPVEPAQPKAPTAQPAQATPPQPTPAPKPPISPEVAPEPPKPPEPTPPPKPPTPPSSSFKRSDLASSDLTEIKRGPASNDDSSLPIPQRAREAQQKVRETYQSGSRGGNVVDITQAYKTRSYQARQEAGTPVHIAGSTGASVAAREQSTDAVVTRILEKEKMEAEERLKGSNFTGKDQL